jgi:hypothetical protein
VPRRRATRRVATPMSNDCLLGSLVFVVFIYLFILFFDCDDDVVVVNFVVL